MLADIPLQLLRFCMLKRDVLDMKSTWWKELCKEMNKKSVPVFGTKRFISHGLDSMIAVIHYQLTRTQITQLQVDSN